MHFAVYGILADGAGSSAGTFAVLLRALLERGHRVDFFGNPKFIRPRSFEGVQGYRFVPLNSPAAERLWETSARAGSAHLEALVSQVNILLYQRLAMHTVEAEHRLAGYDVVLQTDVQALWPSSLPMISWPQSPPQTEGGALRIPDVARLALRSQGRARYAAVQVYYGYRALLAKATLGFSDRYVCGSEWAVREWERFGASRARLASISYPLSLEPFAGLKPPGARDTITFLWLGRATPRKRIDLFLEAFERLQRRRPDVRARLLGNFHADAETRALLDRYARSSELVVEPPVARAEVPALLSEIDVLVQPSQNEHFGHAMAEALAAGRAVVAGPTNGTFEYAGEAGFGFDEYSPEAVAGAMERAGDAVRKDGAAIARHARVAAERNFSTAVVVEKFETLCRELLAERGRGQ